MNEQLLRQAQAAASPKELMELAQAEQIQLDEAAAQDLFHRLHSSGELADEELDAVSGGGCGDASVGNYRRGDLVLVVEKLKCTNCGRRAFIVREEWPESKDRRSYTYDLECNSCGWGKDWHRVPESDILGRIY